MINYNPVTHLYTGYDHNGHLIIYMSIPAVGKVKEQVEALIKEYEQFIMPPLVA